MFLSLSEPVRRGTIAKIVIQLVEEVISEFVQGFLVETAAIEAVEERIISEEVSVVDMVDNEMELAIWFPSLKLNVSVLMRSTC